MLTADQLAEWLQTIEQIEQALVETMNRTPEVPATPAPATEEATQLEQLAYFGEWQTRLENVERLATDAERDLEHDQDPIGEWLLKSRDLRELLAVWARGESPVQKAMKAKDAA